MSKIEFLKQRTKPLPASLEGLKVFKRMSQHLNFGRDGGGGVEVYHEQDGQPLPFTQQWRVGSRKPGVNFTGMFLGEVGPLTVAELQFVWPAYVASVNGERAAWAAYVAAKQKPAISPLLQEGKPGQFLARCMSCGEQYEIQCSPEDFKEEGNVCNGSDRCAL